MANDEPMDEPEHVAAADKPVDENPGKSGKFLNKRYKNMKTRRGYGKKIPKKESKGQVFQLWVQTLMESWEKRKVCLKI